MEECGKHKVFNREPVHVCAEGLRPIVQLLPRIDFIKDGRNYERYVRQGNREIQKEIAVVADEANARPINDELNERR